MHEVLSHSKFQIVIENMGAANGLERVDDDTL